MSKRLHHVKKMLLKRISRFESPFPSQHQDCSSILMVRVLCAKRSFVIQQLDARLAIRYCYWLDLSGLKHFTFMSIFEYFDFCDHLTSFFVTIRHTLQSKFRQLFKSPRNSESFGYILAFLTFLTLWPTFFKCSTYVNIWFKILKIVEMA